MIIQKRIEIFSIIAILFLIIGLILLSWFTLSLQDSEVFVVSHQGIEKNASQVLSIFDRQEDQENYYLTYGWADFNGHSHNLSFPLSKNLLNEAEKEVGYFPTDLRKHMEDSMELSIEMMIEDLREFVHKLIQKSKYPEYILSKKSRQKALT